MPRRKTHGETIGVQLPLALDTSVRLRAQLAGLSPGAWIAEQLGERTAESPQISTSPPKPVTAAHSDCKHPAPKRAQLGGGLMKCTACQRVRGADGVWRAT